MARIVLATKNRGKLRELRELLRGRIANLEVDTEVVDAAGLAVPEVPETGVSFAENSMLKARAVAEATGLIAIADDSGLCVDIFGGAPGIFSARWAGKHGDDTANLHLLLAQLQDIAPEHRTARFSCAASLAVPQAHGGYEAVTAGHMPGVLLQTPAGDGGFGYDPIMLPDELNGDTPRYEGKYAGLSCAQIPSEVKNAISHRGHAFEALVPDLIKALEY